MSDRPGSKTASATVAQLHRAAKVGDTASAALQAEELGLFEADRAVRAACGSAP